MPLAAATYEVGPGQALASPGDVPWESLAAGDTVLIHWRAAPYTNKWVICRQGTADAPITVRGVPGAGGELPVIDAGAALHPDTLPAHEVVREYRRHRTSERRLTFQALDLGAYEFSPYEAWRFGHFGPDLDNLLISGD
jgi:hypothetical protein